MLFSMTNTFKPSNIQRRTFSIQAFICTAFHPCFRFIHSHIHTFTLYLIPHFSCGGRRVADRRLTDLQSLHHWHQPVSSMRQHSSLDWILPLFPTYRDLLHYKNVLYDVEKAKTRLSAEDAVHKHYPDSLHPPPVSPPFRFTWSHLNSLLPRVSKRLELLVAEGAVDQASSPEQRREAAWQSLRQQPSRRAPHRRERAPQQQPGQQRDDEEKAMGEQERREEEEVKDDTTMEEQEMPCQPQQTAQQLHPDQQPPHRSQPQPQPLVALDEQQRHAERLREVQEQQQQHNSDLSRQLATCQDQLLQSQRQHEGCQQRLKQQSDLVEKLEKNVKELSADCEKRLSASREALKLTMLQGYIIRACHEFTLRCPSHDHPLLNDDKLEQVTLKEACTLLSCVRAFSTFSALPDHQQLYVDADSSSAHLKIVLRRLNLMVHPDKLPVDVIPDNRGHVQAHRRSSLRDQRRWLYTCLWYLTICSSVSVCQV